MTRMEDLINKWTDHITAFVKDNEVSPLEMLMLADYAKDITYQAVLRERRLPQTNKELLKFAKDVMNKKIEFCDPVAVEGTGKNEMTADIAKQVGDVKTASDVVPKGQDVVVPKEKGLDPIPVQTVPRYFVDFYDMSDGWTENPANLFKAEGCEGFFDHLFTDDLEKAKKICDKKQKELGQGNKDCGEYNAVRDLTTGKIVYSKRG